MGLLGRMLALYFFLAIALLAFGAPTPFTTLMAGTADWTDVISSTFTLANITAIAAIIAASIIFTGTINIALIIIIPLAVFLVSFFTFPAALLAAGGLPLELKVLIEAVYFVLNFMFGFAIVSWFKGGGD